MKIITIEGNKKIKKFFCEACGTEWKTDEYITTESIIPKVFCFSDQCPICNTKTAYDPSA